ncbi:hypothetical protein RGQ29_030905 [Quercus rubra]|uniref:BED-type domain-containing protein n=1 Tax=Quercus rubra TaxID=3512 RepID=A0AAN7EK19_QUERU|nr:hypothetical protein RGQ29_030905 [Quercus rubra]
MTHRNNHIILDDLDEQGQHFESIGSPTSPVSPTSNVPTNNNTTLGSNPSVTNKKLKSEVWKTFDRVERIKQDGTKEIKAICSKCGDELAGGPSAGTNHLKRHILNSCKRKNQMDIRDFQQLGKDKEGNLTTFIYTDANAQNEVVEYLVRAEHPFTFVEKYDFTGMVQRGFTPQYKGFSASAAKRDIMKSFKFYKEKLKIGLSNLSSSVEKIKDIVRNINSSQARYELNKKNINIDVPHRWNATYLLLDSAIKYKDILNLYYSHLFQNSRCPLEKIEEHDWMLAELVRDFLKTIQSFQNSMTQLFDYYGNAYKNFDIGAQTQNTRSSLSSTSSLSDQEEQNAYHMVKRRREQASSVTSGGLSEFQRYLNQPLLEIDEEGSFDLLGWWKTNQSKYPILSIMAREILSVLVSTVASEASFSASGRVVSDKRCGLSPETVEALVCLKDWNLADTRRQEAEQEVELAKAFERLKLERPE